MCQSEVKKVESFVGVDKITYRGSGGHQKEYYWVQKLDH